MTPHYIVTPAPESEWLGGQPRFHVVWVTETRTSGLSGPLGAKAAGVSQLITAHQEQLALA